MLYATQLVNTKNSFLLPFVVWGEAYERQGKLPLGFPRPQDNVWPYLLGYVALRTSTSHLLTWMLHTYGDAYVPSEVITALITVLSQVPSVYSSLRASRELYRSMLLSVIRYGHFLPLMILQI